MSDGVPGWSLAWSEEFDGDAGSPPDPRTWRMETGNGGWGNVPRGPATEKANSRPGSLAVTVQVVQ